MSNCQTELSSNILLFFRFLWINVCIFIQRLCVYPNLITRFAHLTDVTVYLIYLKLIMSSYQVIDDLMCDSPPPIIYFSKLFKILK